MNGTHWRSFKPAQTDVIFNGLVSIGKNWCVHSWLQNNSLFFPLWRRLAVSFCISPDLCCINTNSADSPPHLAAAANDWKRCFYTWVSKASITILSLSLFLSLSVFFYFSVNWYYWCDVNVLKFLFCVWIFFPDRKKKFFCLVFFNLISSVQSWLSTIQSACPCSICLCLSYLVNPAFIPRFHQFRSLWH